MLKLLPPGKRKGNRHYIARGTVGGRQIEFTTGTADKAIAERVAAAAFAKFVASPSQPIIGRTFRYVAEAYVAFRYPALTDAETAKMRGGDPELREKVAQTKRAIDQINRLVTVLGHLPLEAISHADLVAAAESLCPSHKASSKNKLVIAPAAAILHYAADNKWCAYQRFKRFKEPRAITRAIPIDAARRLVEIAEGHPRALLVFLLRQGMRISDTIAVTWGQINLDAGTIEVRIRKTDQYVTKALHPEALAALAALPVNTDPQDRVFPYCNRWAVYRVLTPIALAAGVEFTPHMARHSLGKWLNASGAGLRTIMDTLDHADPKSSMRYQSTDVEGQKRALAKVERLSGKVLGKAKKA